MQSICSWTLIKIYEKLTFSKKKLELLNNFPPDVCYKTSMKRIWFPYNTWEKANLIQVMNAYLICKSQ